MAVLASLAIVCAARPLLVLLADAARRRGWEGRFDVRRAGRAVGAAALAGAVVFVGLLIVAGNPARSSAEATVLPTSATGELIDVTVKPAQGIAPIDEGSAQQIARDLVADLENESAALRRRDRTRATAGADGARLAALWRQIAAPGGAADVPHYAVERIRVTLEPGDGQAAADRRRARVGNGDARGRRRAPLPRPSSSC